jgi:hypothetical protein
MRSLYELDTSWPCTVKSCRARAGEPCRGLERGTVHFGRRVRRLLAELRLRDVDRRELYALPLRAYRRIARELARVRRRRRAARTAQLMR